MENKNSPLVSIIVPVYNVEQYLRQCVDSILSQTFSDFELILVDDGSPDNCGAICDKYAEKDNRIIVIHKENGGVSSARNSALDIATGEYIIFVDSDDTVNDSYVSELIKWQDFDFVTAGYNYQAPNGEWYERIFQDDSVFQNNLKLFPSKYIGKYYFGSPWATLMKKQIIDSANLRFDKNIHSGEDTLFIMQYLAYAEKIKSLPHCGYNYFYHSGSLSKSTNDTYWKWRIYIEEEINTFFSPTDDFEKNILLERHFSVLKELLNEYYAQNDNNCRPL